MTLQDNGDGTVTLTLDEHERKRFGWLDAGELDWLTKQFALNLQSISQPEFDRRLGNLTGVRRAQILSELDSVARRS